MFVYSLDASASGPGDPGKFTLQAGMLAYYEICQQVTSHRWTKVPATSERGPYAHRLNQWVGYDDVNSVKVKAEFVKQEGYGGVHCFLSSLDR